MPTVPDLYDVLFTVQSGANAGEYGFMLVRPPESSKSINVEEVGGPSAERISTDDVATHQDFDPRYDTPFAMADFSGGVGQLEWDGNDDSAVLWATGLVLHVNGKVFLAPGAAGPLTMASSVAAITGFKSYLHSNGVQYDFCWAGVHLYRRSAADSTTNWELVYTAGGTISDFAIFATKGYISVDTYVHADEYYQQDDLTAAATWTPIAKAVDAFTSTIKPKFCASVRGTFFAAVDNAKVFYTVDPTANSWLGPIEATVGALSGPDLGDASYQFQGLVAVNDYLFCMKEDAVYSIDSQQNVSEVLWQWKDKPSTSNFKFSAVSGDQLVFCVGPEVYVYDPGNGAVSSMMLGRFSGFSTQAILGVGADNQYVYVLARVRPGLQAADSIVLLRCYRRRTNWIPEVIWEDATIGTKIYQGLSVLPRGTASRVYWGFQASPGAACSTYVMDIPADWDESTSTSFRTSGELITSITRAAFPGFMKRHLWLNLETSGVTHGGTQKITVSYSVDNGASFTALGNTDTGAAQLTQLAYNDVSSRNFLLKFVFAGNGSLTPVMRVFDHHQRVQFRYLPAVTPGIAVGSKLERNNGTIDTRQMATVLNQLRMLRAESGRITFKDFIGHEFDCSVDQLAFRPVKHEKPDSMVAVEALLRVVRADAGA